MIYRLLHYILCINIFAQYFLYHWLFYKLIAILNTCSGDALLLMNVKYWGFYFFYHYAFVTFASIAKIKRYDTMRVSMKKQALRIITQKTYNAMAKLHSTTFGAISGKHGTAVAVTRKDGTSYLRVHVKAHNPRTDKQQAHRAKFALTSKALAPFNSIFKHTMGVTNGISIARSKNAIVNEYPNFSIDYKKIMFSFGTLEKLQNASTTSDNGVVSINWDFKKMYNCHGNDSVSLVVFNKDTNQALHIENIASRKDRQTKINIQESWTNSEIYFWAYVRRGDKISDSVAVGANQHSPNITNQHSSNVTNQHSSNVMNNHDYNNSNNVLGCDAKWAIFIRIVIPHGRKMFRPYAVYHPKQYAM